MTPDVIQGACLMELNELIHTSYLESWGVEVVPHPRMKDWLTVQITIVATTEKTFELDLMPPVDVDGLRNDLWIQSELINHWIDSL